MKASEIIRAALENHYSRGVRSDYKEENKTAPFMCHAVEFQVTGDMMDYNHPDFHKVEEVNQTFMVKIVEARKTTLCDFLNHTDDAYHKAYTETGTHHAVECFDIRVKWWNAHIDELEAKGL